MKGSDRPIRTLVPLPCAKLRAHYHVIGANRDMPNRPSTFLKPASAILLVLICAGVAWRGWSRLSHYIEGNPFDAQFAIGGVWVPLHFFFGAMAIFLVPWQFYKAVRRFRWLHRLLGWTYLGSIMISGVSGLVMAQNAFGGHITTLGFTALALVWLATSLNAVWKAIRKDFSAHRRWMLRSAAVTLSAFTLRVILGTGAVVLDLPLVSVYQFAAWASWLINLALIELWLLRDKRLGFARFAS